MLYPLDSLGNTGWRLVGPTINLLCLTDRVVSAWASAGYPQEIIKFQSYYQDPQNQKKWVPGPQKATKKTSKRRLNIIQFTKHVKKWNLTNTIVFTMFSAHPTPDPGIIFSPKPTKKHTSKLTLKISHLKPRKKLQIAQNRLQSGSRNSSKIIENPTLDPKVSPLVSQWTPGSPTCWPKASPLPPAPCQQVTVDKLIGDMDD